MDSQNYNEMYQLYVQITSEISRNVANVNEDTGHMLTVYDLMLVKCFVQDGIQRGRVSQEELEFIKEFGDSIGEIRQIVPKFPYFLRHCTKETYEELEDVVFPEEEFAYFKSVYQKMQCELPSVSGQYGTSYLKQLMSQTKKLLQMYTKGIHGVVNLDSCMEAILGTADSCEAVTTGTGGQAQGSLKNVVSGREAMEAWMKQEEEEQKKNKGPETKEERLARKLEELQGLIGLEPVKREVQNLVYSFKADKMRAEMGLDTFKDTSYHLVFSGSPGTGKTTVARLIGEIYHCLDILPSTTFVEASKADLEAGYVGQTALKTTALVEKALGGVLFIDEAYSLIKSDYGLEAIDILVQMMENHRSELVLIVAGYAKDMEEFLAANAGLRSRFKRTIYFPDYSGQELMEILDKFLKGWIIPDEVREYAVAQFENATGKIGFGNGRTARDIAGKIKANVDFRVGQMSMKGMPIEKSMLQTVTMEDVVEAFRQSNLISENTGIGFIK